MERKAKQLKPIVIFSDMAWAKIESLICFFDTEVQWHGVVERKDKYLYIVKDILVPPHEVNGASVISDQTEYEEWLDSLTDEEFRGLKLHGHSHVRMDVIPSSVDVKYRLDRTSVLPTSGSENSYYIFMIINKDWKLEMQIFDASTGTVYNKDDINIVTGSCMDDLVVIADFIKDAYRKTNLLKGD